MENWYVPITILPGIGLLILSTSNLLIALSNEIAERIQLKKCNDSITTRKLKQLHLLNKGLVGLYVGAATLVAAGILFGIQNFYDISQNIGIALMLVGVLSTFISISYLIKYSVRAVKIRQDQFNESTY
ncbi:hypothetical protein D7030_14125 [Flavobacteriaceae bacterium AU392]|nr:hypothetical protein D1817_04365 [Flavobacteriaceae bacterium]RKM81440.1 hypothetical protein D7030_14125 [Flavobacteriaceae bacterium AU392]